MKRRPVGLLLVALLFLSPSTFLSAQAAKSALSGTVTDTGGGVIPGATVDVKT